MIPHIIHYIWFGGAEKPKVVLECIESWRRFFPGWEIKEWNESNYNINKCQYMIDAYQLKKYAFVSDYARFDVLYEYGGIYLDVDVEFIKPLPADFLEHECIAGFEGSGEVSPGLIFAAVPHYWFTKGILETYQNDRFLFNKDGIYRTVNTRTSEILNQYGLKKNNQYQVVNGIHIYPSEIFCGYDTDIREPVITEDTICWHHYLGSWNRKSIKTKMQDFLKSVIGKKNYKKLVLLKRSLKNGSN